ncbi:MAG: MBL fold metallo-hydrolase, partial [Moorella humiferrea]|nr:MBL fold metallo-hydrolase [Moorella humiferrea]
GKIKNFNFVYDCGSTYKEPLQRAIDNYILSLGSNNKIEFLVLSHLHNDHVSGLNQLMAKAEIKQVIMPYFSPIERLILALKRINLAAWYYKFLSDPVSYLLENGVEKVIIFGKSNNENTEAKTITDLDELPDDNTLRDEILEREPNLKRAYAEKRLLIKQHHGYWNPHGIWEFIFFNHKIQESKLDQFRDCINNKGYLYDNDILRKTIANKAALQHLKECYKVINNDLNFTSLLLFHGPAENSISNTQIIIVNNISNPFCGKAGVLICANCSIYENGCPYILKSLFEPSPYYQLLTGDIKLNGHVIYELQRHFGCRLNSLTVCLVPHHGSKRSWNNDILKATPNCYMWITSAGAGNSYMHPSRSVIKSLLHANRNVYYANELSEVIIKG